MLENLTSDLSLRMIILGFVALCTIIGFLKGLGRLVLFAIALAAGAVAAVAWFRYMPGLCISWFGKNRPDFVKWGAVVAGVAAMWIARRFLHVMIKGSGDGGAAMDQKSRLRGGLFGLLPALLLVWGGAVGVRWAGSAGRLRHLEEAVDQGNTAPLVDTGFFERVSRSLERGLAGDLMNRTDPMSSRESVALGSLLVLQRNATIWERTVRHPLSGPVVLLPPFRKLRDDNDVLHALSFSHYSRLLTLPELDAALADRVLREAVLGLDLDTLLPELITGRAAGPPPRAIPVPEA